MTTVGDPRITYSQNYCFTIIKNVDIKFSVHDAFLK